MSTMRHAFSDSPICMFVSQPLYDKTLILVKPFSESANRARFIPSLHVEYLTGVKVFKVKYNQNR